MYKIFEKTGNDFFQDTIFSPTIRMAIKIPLAAENKHIHFSFLKPSRILPSLKTCLSIFFPP